MQNRWTPLAIFPETLDPPPPPWNFGKNIPYPLPWIFNPCASMYFRQTNARDAMWREATSAIWLKFKH
jgi:hypothetical protein